MKDDEYPYIQVFFDVYEKNFLGSYQLICSFIQEWDAVDYCRKKNGKSLLSSYSYRQRIVK